MTKDLKKKKSVEHLEKIASDFKERRISGFHYSGGNTLCQTKKWKSHIEGTQERKCEPRTINPAKLTFVYKKHRDARIQGILLPWALSQTSYERMSVRQQKWTEGSDRKDQAYHTQLLSRMRLNDRGNGRGYMVAECTDSVLIDTAYLCFTFGKKGKSIYKNTYIYFLTV